MCAYTPSDTLLTNTLPFTVARSIVRSKPSLNASREPTTSSRSTPRSSAKWLRVPGRDAHEREAVLARDARDQCLGTVAARHPEHVGAPSDRVAGERGEVVARAGARPARSPAARLRAGGRTSRPCRHPTTGSSGGRAAGPAAPGGRVGARHGASRRRRRPRSDRPPPPAPRPRRSRSPGGARCRRAGARW